MEKQPTPSGDIRRRWELRVLIALPAVWVLLAAVEAYLTVDLTLSAVGSVPGASHNLLAVERVRLIVVGIVSLTALVVGLAFAVAVTRPIRQLLQRVQYRLHGTAESLTAANEIVQLSNAFDDMLLSFDKFVTDSQIIKGMPVAILVVDKSDLVIRANVLAHRLFRPTRREVVGSSLSDLCAPDARARLTEALNTVRKSGIPADVPLGLAPGSENTTESRPLVTLQPTTITGEVVVSVRDLSQLQTIRGHIQRVDQLAALGAHVASLAHEISGALMGIQLLLDLWQPQGDDRLNLSAKLRAEVERAIRLLAEVRTFGQVNARERVVCNLATLVEQTLWSFDSRFGDKQITLAKRLTPEALPLILVDRDRVIQAVLNVVTNAVEATPTGGTVTVTTRRENAASVVTIGNTGSFIPIEDRQKIFTLFFTTKRSGTGIGLPLARRALLDHGGDIEVTSSPEEGTEFSLRFPDQPPISEVPPTFEARQSDSQRAAS